MASNFPQSFNFKTNASPEERKFKLLLHYTLHWNAILEEAFQMFLSAPILGGALVHLIISVTRSAQSRDNFLLGDDRSESFPVLEVIRDARNLMNRKGHHLIYMFEKHQQRKLFSPKAFPVSFQKRVV